jgi:hypothetical protein
VSTWTEVTVEHVDGDEIDWAVVESVLEEHAGMDFFNGEGPNHPPLPESAHDPNRAVVVASQQGKYMVDADWRDVSRRLIEQLGNVRLTVTEEWDDEGPGRDSTVYEDGKAVDAKSTSMRDVNDELAKLLDVSQPPETVTVEGLGLLIVVPPKATP